MKRTLKRAMSLLLSVILSLTAMSAGIFATAEGEDIDYIEAVAQYKLIEDVDISYEYGYTTPDCYITPDCIRYSKYRIYNAEPLITVHYKNGGSESVDYWQASFTDDQTADNKWGVGIHTVTGIYRGFVFTFNVEVAENPVESISVQKTVKLFEGVDGHWEETALNQKWFRYDLSLNSDNLIVTFKDGKSTPLNEVNMNEKFGRYYGWNYGNDDQSPNNQWKIGSVHRTTVTFMGKTAEFNVEILENPVKNITVTAGKKIIKETNGYFTTDYNGKTWYRYYTDNTSNLIVTFKDGSSMPYNSINFDEIFGGPRWYSTTDDQSYENQWDKGPHKVKIEFMGKSAEYTVEILEKPIKKLEVTAAKPLIQNVSGYESYTNWNERWFKYDIYSAEISVKIYMADGRVLNSNEINPYEEFGEYAYLELIDDQSPDNQWTPGTHRVTAKYFGVTSEFEVTVTENKDNAEFQYVEQGGNVYITDYIGSSETVTVPSEIDGKKVAAITDFNLSHNKNLSFVKKLIIPDGVKSVSYEALQSLSALEYAEIGADISQLYNYCFPTTLKGITVSKNNKSYCSLDDVVYNKAMTALVIYPFSRGRKLSLPATVTDVSVISGIGVNVDLDTSAASKSFKTKDGVTYTADMKTVISCDTEKSGKYEMPSSVTGVVYGAFANCTKLTEVQLSPALTSVVYKMFINCTSLKTVTVPDSVVQIDGAAFAGCTSLEGITLPEKVVSIGETAFSGSGLTKINLPQQLDFIGYKAFEGSKLQSISIPKSVTYISDNAFASTPLVSLTLPASNIQIGEAAFAYTDLAELTLPNGPTFGGSAFAECKSLKKVTIAEGRTDLEYEMFSGCTALETVVLPSTLNYIDEEAFLDCKSLKSISLPENITAIRQKAFKGCVSLKSVNLPQGLSMISDSAFEGCALTSVKLPERLDYLGTGAFNGCPLSELEIKNISEISGGAFAGTQITKLVLPDTVTTIAYRAFADCSKLLDIEIPDSVISISGDSFAGTAWSNTHADGEMYLNKAFYGYKGKMSPENSVLQVKDGTKTIADYLAEMADETFRLGLSRLILPNGLLHIGGASFENCRALKSVNIPESVTEIGSYAFAGCESLEKIYIPASVEQIGHWAFINCDSLTEITVSPDNPNYSSVDGVLYNKNKTRLICCPAGKTGKITIPDTVHSIQNGAFSRCKKLTQVIIPKSVTSIDYGAFGFDYTRCYRYEEYTFTLRFSGNYSAFEAPAGSTAAAYIARLDRLPCKEHNLTDWMEYRKNTCTLAGELVRNCTECDYYEAKTVAVKGHSYSGEYIIDKAPTCTEDGQLSKRCSDCGILVPDSVIIIKANGHKFGNWTTVKTQSCHSDGERTHECSVCRTKEAESIPAEHRRGLWYWVIEPEMNNGTGFKSADCEDCHEKRIVTVQATELDNVGDLNDDKAINIKDIINIKKQLAKTDAYSREADLNRDGSLNSQDMTMLRKYLLSVLKAL